MELEEECEDGNLESIDECDSECKKEELVEDSRFIIALAFLFIEVMMILICLILCFQTMKKINDPKAEESQENERKDGIQEEYKESHIEESIEELHKESET